MMKYAEITGGDIDKKYFDVTFSERSMWTFHFSSLSTDDFCNVFYNIHGIIKTLNNNDEIIKKLNRFHDKDHVGAIVGICVEAFRKHPEVIMDFDKFTEFIVGKYFENLQYFSEIIPKAGEVFYDAIELAEGRTKENLNGILETTDE